MKKEEFKDGDWTMGYSEFFSQYYIKNIGGRIYWYDGDTYKACTKIAPGTKFLTIKPEAMQKNTVVHCPEKWMAEALCWCVDRLGLMWYRGESYLEYTRWKTFKNQTCYNLSQGLFANVDCYKSYKIIPFWDAVCGEDSVDICNNNKRDKVMCEEKKYEWNKDIDSISIHNILIETPECKDKEAFKAWCFDRYFTHSKIILFPSISSDNLLKELRKPERKAWLSFAIKQGYVKEVEETLKIGDVIETGYSLKFIINAVSENIVVFNDEFGRRSNDVLSVVDPFKISKKDIECHLADSIKKVGHGVKDLI